MLYSDNRARFLIALLTGPFTARCFLNPRNNSRDLFREKEDTVSRKPGSHSNSCIAHEGHDGGGSTEAIAEGRGYHEESFLTGAGV